MTDAERIKDLEAKLVEVDDWCVAVKSSDLGPQNQSTLCVSAPRRNDSGLRVEFGGHPLGGESATEEARGECNACLRVARTAALRARAAAESREKALRFLSPRCIHGGGHILA